MAESLAVAGAAVALGVAAALTVGPANRRAVFLETAVRIVSATLAVANRGVRAALDAADALPIATTDIRAPRVPGWAALAVMAGAIAAIAVAADRLVGIAAFTVARQSIAIGNRRRGCLAWNWRPGVSAPGGVGVVQNGAGAGYHAEPQERFEHGPARGAIRHRPGYRIESAIVHRAAMPFRKSKSSHVVASGIVDEPAQRFGGDGRPGAREFAFGARSLRYCADVPTQPERLPSPVPSGRSRCRRARSSGGRRRRE